jgi:hypothetical protein
MTTSGYQPHYDHGASINAPTYGFAAPVASMPYYSREELGMDQKGARSLLTTGDDTPIPVEDAPWSSFPLDEPPVTILPYRPSWWAANKKKMAIIIAVIIILLVLYGGYYYYTGSQ